MELGEPVYSSPSTSEVFEGLEIIVYKYKEGFVFTYGGDEFNHGLYGKTETEPFATLEEAVEAANTATWKSCEMDILPD